MKTYCTFDPTFTDEDGTYMVLDDADNEGYAGNLPFLKDKLYNYYAKRDRELETDFDVQDVEVLEYYEKDNQYRLLLNLEDDTNLDRLQDIVHDLDIDIEYV